MILVVPASTILGCRVDVRSPLAVWPASRVSLALRWEAVVLIRMLPPGS